MDHRQGSEARPFPEASAMGKVPIPLPAFLQCPLHRMTKASRSIATKERTGGRAIGSFNGEGIDLQVRHQDPHIDQVHLAMPECVLR